MFVIQFLQLEPGFVLSHDSAMSNVNKYRLWVQTNTNDDPGVRARFHGRLELGHEGPACPPACPP
jgi:hypothetical protein